MAKLIYSAIASLDGYVAGEDGNFDWAAPDGESSIPKTRSTCSSGRSWWEAAHRRFPRMSDCSSNCWTNAASVAAWFTSTTGPERPTRLTGGALD